MRQVRAILTSIYFDKALTAHSPDPSVPSVTERNPVSPLLSPLKWAAKSVASLVDLDPAICVELCKIEHAQMHVVALVLAHLEVNPTPELGRLLLCGSIQQVFTETLSRDPPAGLRRAVGHMPAKVLAKDSYRRLVSLLDHRPTAKLLFHTHRIDDALIDLLFVTAPPIRRHVFQLAQSRGAHWSQYARLSEGLRVLVARVRLTRLKNWSAAWHRRRDPNSFLAK